MNLPLPSIILLLFFPGGLFLIVLALTYEWVDRKLLARFQNRIGPRWFQTVADIVKLLVKEEITPATMVEIDREGGHVACEGCGKEPRRIVRVTEKGRN